MTEDLSIDRIPLGRSVRYAVRGLPDLPYQYGRGVLVPTEITLTYRDAPDSQLGRVHAYVAGRIKVDGQEIPHANYGQHYDEGLSNWPECLTVEARLHDLAAPPAVPSANRADDVQRIADAARTVRLHLGPNAVAAAQRGESIILSGGEADAVAAAVLSVLPANDRATTLLWAADRFDHVGRTVLAASQVRDKLRRLAGEVAQDRRAPGPDAIAYRIRAELVCCDLYDRVNVRKELTIAQAMESKDWHDLCYWGEASARLAEGRCPGYETKPNICRCDCEGCKHNCAAHSTLQQARPGDEYGCPSCSEPVSAGHRADHVGGQGEGEARSAARPRCPHCHLPHDLTPGSMPVAMCQAIRSRLADAARMHADGDHSQCAAVDCLIVRTASELRQDSTSEPYSKENHPA
ncbi:hypothetical protein [Streptomyces sp. NPDC094468]|uniref:hypothetical protein n=1 Tax=Streptomyces sp. NPDC094468 TaxID=3366066 RepID=UPI003821F5FE